MTKKDVLNYFSSMCCDKCDFAKECEGLHNHERRYTTNTISLCGVIRGSAERFDDDF